MTKKPYIRKGRPLPKRYTRKWCLRVEKAPFEIWLEIPPKIVYPIGIMDFLFDKAGAELLFNHLSPKAGRKSTIITINSDFKRWHEIFLDPVLTAALIDRLTHKAHLINMGGV